MKLHHRLLIWAYQSNPQLVRITGRSPLDIPSKTVLLAFIAALILAIGIGNVFINTVHTHIYRDLAALEEVSLFDITAQTTKNQEKLSELVAVAFVGEILPQFKSRIRDSGKEVIQGLHDNFQTGKLTVAGLAAFIGRPDAEESLRHAIVGPLERSVWSGKMIPYFAPESPDKVADQFNLPVNYEEQQGEVSEETWRRFLFISAIQLMRDELGQSIQQPFRLLKALGGGIQWTTFICAIWCLLLLLTLRRPWARLQTYLIVHERLPWHAEEKDVWDIRFKAKYFDKIDETYPRMFTPVRLIKEVINRTSSGDETSIYDIIRERLRSYREAVEAGEYELINFLLWATPTFGFIGTIFGIIGAMENAAGIFAAATPVEQGIALDKVSTALGTAFDTSFIALIWLVPMTFFLAKTRKAEANMFEELEYEAIGKLPFQVGTQQTYNPPK